MRLVFRWYEHYDGALREPRTDQDYRYISYVENDHDSEESAVESLTAWRAKVDPQHLSPREYALLKVWI